MDSNLLKQYLTGSVAGIQVTQTTLLLGSILMEISIAMTLLSRFASRATSRPLNIVAAIITFLAQAATLFKPVTSYYMFFSVIEIGASLSILILAIFWKSGNQKTSSLALWNTKSTLPK